MLEFCQHCEHRGHTKCGAKCEIDPQRRSVYVMVTLQREELPEKCPGRDSNDPPRPKPAELPVAVPRGQWPILIRMLADQASGADGGVGDTLERLAPDEAKRMAAALKAAGIDCGCSGRQAWLNARYPLKTRKNGA